MSVKKLSDGIERKLDAMVKRVNTMPQFFLRNVKRRYLAAQKVRWMNENSDSKLKGGAWAPLSEPYATEKPKRFKAFPGAGQKLLIAKNTLVNSILGLSTDYREVVGDRTYIVSTTVPYATFVDEKRSITGFTETFYDDVRTDLRKYVMAGTL